MLLVKCEKLLMLFIDALDQDIVALTRICRITFLKIGSTLITQVDLPAVDLIIIIIVENEVLATD